MCEPNKKAERSTQTQPARTTLLSWPFPPLLPTGNVGHAPTLTRGAINALCVLLPVQSTKHSLLRLWQMLPCDSVCANAQQMMTQDPPHPLRVKNNNQLTMGVSKAQWLAREHQQPDDDNGRQQQMMRVCMCVLASVYRGVPVKYVIPIASDPPWWHPLHNLGLIVLPLRTPPGACKKGFQLVRESWFWDSVAARQWLSLRLYWEGDY